MQNHGLWCTSKLSSFGEPCHVLCMSRTIFHPSLQNPVFTHFDRSSTWWFCRSSWETFTSKGLTILIDASLAILQNRPRPVGSEWLNGLPLYRDLRWSLARSFCHSHWAQRWLHVHQLGLQNPHWTESPAVTRLRYPQWSRLERGRFRQWQMQASFICCIIAGQWTPLQPFAQLHHASPQWRDEQPAQESQ